MTDYSKWDQLSNEIVQEEENEKIRKRNENKAKYYKEQQEKQMKYMKEHPEEFKQNNHNHEHNHDHSSHDGHSHNDSHSDTIQSTSSFQSYRPKCGCGYANPEELLKLSQEKAKEPVLSAEEKNKKKWNAVLATKEHGKILFTEQKYKEAFSVYERGVLICTGMYGDLDSEFEQKISDMEVLLNLNMSLCSIKLKNYLEAKQLCLSAIQLSPNHPKCYFRLAQSYLGMGEYNEVRKNLLKCKELINNNSHNNNTNSTNNNGNNNSNAGNSILFEKPISINEVEKLEKECDRCEKDEIEKEKKFHKQMGNKLKKLDLDEK